MLRKLLAVAVLAVAVLLLSAPVSHAIVNGSVPVDSETRFDAVGALAVTWRLGLDPTNPDPATGDHNWYCAATLTNSSTVYTAKHCVDAYGASAPHAVRFRRALDGSVGTIGAGVASFYHAYVASWDFPGGDVAIGTLAEPVMHIAPIQAIVDEIVLPIGTELVLAGWGKEGPGMNEGMVQRLKTCSSQLLGTVSDYVLFPSAWDPAGPLCGPNNNDSGGATLIYVQEGTSRHKLELLAVIGSYTAAELLTP